MAKDFEVVDNGELSLQKQLKGFFTAMQDNLEQQQKDAMQSMILEVETLGQKVGSAASKADLEPITKRLTEIAAQATEVMNNQKANQDAIDNFVLEFNKKGGKNHEGDKPTFETEWKTQIKEFMGAKDFNSWQSNTQRKSQFEMKAVMTTSNSITGGGVNEYNPRQGLLPAAPRNFRDLIRTVPSDTINFVTYRETSSAQSAGLQTEGSTKTNIQYAFTAGTLTLKYVSGQITFSKQLMFSIPFMEGSLPRMLLRDFYRKENDYFYTSVAVAATGNNAAANPTPTVDIEEIIRMIGNQRNSNFNASIGIIDWAEWARLAVTKPQDYSMPLVVTSPNNDALFVAGMPLIGASWSQSDKVLLFDNDYVERVEAESLRIEFSTENNDNFEKNLVSARVECLEEINLLRTDAVIYRDLGNS